MSLLFDALKRAQGNESKTPDASSRQPADKTSQSEAKALLSATHRPKSRLLPYVVGGLMLLTAGGTWFISQQNQHIPISTQHTDLAAASAVLPTSQVAAASSVADINVLPATGADSLANKGKSWTHPIDTKKHHAKKRRHKQVKPDIQPDTLRDPLQEGYRALSEGRLDQAEHSYLEALAQHPHEKDALLGLAVIAQRKMQTDRASKLYRQVLREDLGNAPAAAGLVSLSMQADLVTAESQLRELLDLKPAAPEFHYALGSVLARQLRWGEAQQAFFRAYSLQPASSLYAYNLAVSLDRLHQPSAALPYYEKAEKLANDPTLDMDAIGRRIQELNSSR